MTATAFHTDLFDEMALERAVSRSSSLRPLMVRSPHDRPSMRGVATDIWSMLYKQRPRHNFATGVELNHAVIRKLEASSEFNQLKQQTQHDIIASEHALSNFSDDLTKWSKLLDTSNVPDLSDKLKQSIEGGLTDDEEDDLNDQLNEILDVDDLMEIMARTAERTSDELEKVYAFASGCGFNLKDLVKGKDAAEAWKLFKVLKDNSKLSKLMEIAGRFARVASATKKMKVRPGRAEVYDIETSNDLTRVLASEFIYLAEPELEDLFYLKFVQGSLQSYELQSDEHVGKGPVIVCVDISVSMYAGFGKNMIRLDWAKAVALAMLMKCKKEKRDIHVVFFNSRVARQFSYPKGEITADQLTSFASVGVSGGTSFPPPLNVSIQRIQEQSEYKKADIIFLSDGDARLSDSYIADFNEKKEEMNFSMMSGCIGYNPGRALTAISDSIHMIGEGDGSSDDFVNKVL